MSSQKRNIQIRITNLQKLNSTFFILRPIDMKNKAKVFDKGCIYKGGGGAEIKNGICFYGLGYVFFSSDQQTH